MQSPPKTGEWWLCHTDVDYDSDMGEDDDTYYAEVVAVHIDDGLANSAYDVQDVGEEAELEKRVVLSRSNT